MESQGFQGELWGDRSLIIKDKHCLSENVTEPYGKIW